MFQKYKVVQYSSPAPPEWGIHKRFLLFFYRPLTHEKFVMKNDGSGLAKGCPSHEILTFRKEEGAESEIDRLESGYPPIRCRVFKNGKLIDTTFRGGSDGHSKKQTYR